MGSRLERHAGWWSTPSVEVYKNTDIQIYKNTEIQMYKNTDIQMYKTQRLEEGGQDSGVTLRAWRWLRMKLPPPNCPFLPSDGSLHTLSFDNTHRLMIYCPILLPHKLLSRRYNWDLCAFISILSTLPKVLMFNHCIAFYWESYCFAFNGLLI